MAQQRRDADEAASAPRELPVSTAHPELRYQIAEDLVADATAPDPAATIRPAADAPATSAEGGSADLAPVYRRGPEGDLVVPTGRVLVRFADSDDAADHEPDLRAAGYVLDHVLPYAPNTAWVRKRGNDIGEALHAMERLSSVPGVAVVEPEMIGTSSKRD